MGILFDRSVSSEASSGAKGEVSLRGDDAGKGHVTQRYADNTRVSWDLDRDGESNKHWTNQSVAKGSSSRHTPPGHARS
jgi:hypothetical protein